MRLEIEYERRTSFSHFSSMPGSTASSMRSSQYPRPSEAYWPGRCEMDPWSGFTRSTHRSECVGSKWVIVAL